MEDSLMRWFLALLFIVLAGAAQAQCPPIPFVFSRGNAIAPEQINDNFTAVIDCAEGAYGTIAGLRLSTNQNPTPGSYFVSKTGSDAADCLTASVSGLHGPCLSISRGVAQALTYDATQRSVIVNIGAGTYNENVAINGTVVGAVNNTNFVTNNVSAPMITLEGASAASTIIIGVPVISGQSYCYTILANNGAQVRLKKLWIKADAPSGACDMSPLYGQVWGTIFIDQDVSIGPSTGNLVSLEQAGAVYVDAGCQSCNSLTLAGGSTNGNGLNVSAHSWFSADSTINIGGALTFGGGYLFLAQTNSLIKLTGNPGVTSGASVTAASFYVGAGSTLQVGIPPATWPGTLGAVDLGGRYYSSDDIPCIGGSAGCPATLAPTNLGASGTASISALSGSYGGAIQLSPVTGGGPGPQAEGFVYIAWPRAFPVGTICVPTLADGTGTWDPQATVKSSGFSTTNGNFFHWINNSVNLTTAQTYYIGFTCNTSK